MFRKLKKKLIVLVTISIFALLSVIITSMNILNYRSIVRECDTMLSILSQNKGRFPEGGHIKDHPLQGPMAPELPYEAGYFSVLLDEQGTLVLLETSPALTVDSDLAYGLAKKALSGNKEKGFLGDFRYQVKTDLNGKRVTFLDSSRMLDSFVTFLIISCIIALLGLILVFLIILFFAGRILRPIGESYEKQKRFITDAGHEIKTPLTIINANVDVLEADLPENECLLDIRQQSERLTTLTNNLIRLARMEECSESMPLIEFPVSDVVAETATAFSAYAISQNKQLQLQIEPMLSICGDASSFSQLVSLLLDNALKYSPAGSDIILQLYKENKSIFLNIKNTTTVPLKKEQLSHVFERFYRADASRNSATGGHGIGLSIAQAIVSAHKGRIQAFCESDALFCISAIFPTA